MRPVVSSSCRDDRHPHEDTTMTREWKVIPVQTRWHIAYAVEGDDGTRSDEYAALFTAAPKLLAACRAMLEAESADAESKAYQLMRDAVAKAVQP
jgi:hypothetical protein